MTDQRRLPVTVDQTPDVTAPTKVSTIPQPCCRRPLLASSSRKPFRRALLIHATLSHPLVALTSGGSQFSQAQPRGRRNRWGSCRWHDYGRSLTCFRCRLVPLRCLL